MTFDSVSIYGVPLKFNLMRFREALISRLEKGELKFVGEINGIKCFEDSTFPLGEMQFWQGNSLVFTIRGIGTDPFEEKLKNQKGK